MLPSRWTLSALPSLTGRTAVITGASSGIGVETARELARAGCDVVVAVRNEAKAKLALASIARDAPRASVTVQHLDLASLQSVQEAAEELRARFRCIDLLINNAGVMHVPHGFTEDGFERHLGTNHLGHFALTGLLLRPLLAAEAARVVTVSSIAHRMRAELNLDDLPYERGYTKLGAYGRSKLANLLFAYELQRRFTRAGVAAQSLAAHPGWATTQLSRHHSAASQWALRWAPCAQSAAEGALPILRAATDPAAEGGQFYGPHAWWQTKGHPVLVTSSDASHDTAMQRGLWDASASLTGVDYAELAPPHK